MSQTAPPDRCEISLQLKPSNQKFPMPKHSKRNRTIKQKGTFAMTTQTAPVQLGVVPAPKEIENTMGARKILEAAIEDFKNKRSTAKAELANSLGKDLAVAQLDVGSAV